MKYALCAFLALFVSACSAPTVSESGYLVYSQTYEEVAE